MGKPSILDRVKAANPLTDPTGPSFADAVQGMAAAQLKSDALKDVGNLGMTAFGVGAAGRGLLGLVQMLRNRPKKTRSGPAYLSLPYPEKAAVSLAPVLDALKGAGRVAGQGFKDVKLGLGVGREAKELAGLRQSAPQHHLQTAREGNDLVSDLMHTPHPSGSNAVGVPGGGDARDVTSGLDLQTLANKLLGRSAEAQTMQGRLGDLTRSEGRGSAMIRPVAAGGLLGLGHAVGKNVPAGKQASFLSGDAAATKSGIPWYGPAMMLSGLAGLGVGWHGTDKILNARRKRDQQAELSAARQEFHDALMGGYSPAGEKAGTDATMVKVGAALDALYQKMQSAVEKQAVDVPNAAGQLAGGYGMYAGLSGLLAGALVYDKMQKRSRRAVIEKALQKRQTRDFVQRPTQIYAVPEPMPAAGG